MASRRGVFARLHAQLPPDFISLAPLPFPHRIVRAGVGVALVALVAVAIASVASSRGPHPAPSCVPATLNASAALAGGSLTVSPAPGSRDASYETQISLLGVPRREIAGVTVTGSSSGTHRGRLVAYSQGDGSSFVPDSFFSQGEQVKVRVLLLHGHRRVPVSWSFTVAERDSTSRSLETPPPPPPPAKPSELQHFVSRPDLLPPTVTVAADDPSAAPGDLFLAPYAGPGPYGPMILDSSGGLVWFKPIPKGQRAADLRVQSYEGRPVLTWWQEPYSYGGRSDGADIIADNAYRTLEVVRAGNGYQPDLHSFQVTPQGTAIFTVYDAIRCNLRAYRAPAEGAIADTVLQELDLKTGLVRYEWHSLDHVPLSDTYSPPGSTGTLQAPWDWFHINVAAEQDGRLLVDARNTWAAYLLDPRSGRIAWTLGGRKSSFKMGPGAQPAWQHDARIDPNGEVSFFDNGATPVTHPQSRVIVLRLDTARKTASLVSSFVHPAPIVAPSQGDFQPLPEGDWFVGWGQIPYFSEFSASGQLLFDARLPGAYQSFTVFKLPWSAAPADAPALVVTGSPSSAIAHVSWNGATAVATWRLLGGPNATSLAPVDTVPREGFETVIPVAAPPPYLQAQALDAQGRVLGTSALVAG